MNKISEVNKILKKYIIMCFKKSILVNSSNATIQCYKRFYNQIQTLESMPFKNIKHVCTFIEKYSFDFIIFVKTCFAVFKYWRINW